MSDAPSPAVQDFYPDDFSHCYGCGRLNQHGLHIKTRWEDEEAVAELAVPVVLARQQPRPQPAVGVGVRGGEGGDCGARFRRACAAGGRGKR